MSLQSTDKQPTLRISAARKELLAKYANASGILYGVLSLSEFVQVFNHYEQPETNEREARLGLERFFKSNRSEVKHTIYQEFVLGPFFMPFKSEDTKPFLNKIRSAQIEKPRFLPDKNEFLKFSNEEYINPAKPYAELGSHIIENKLHKYSEGTKNEKIGGDLFDLHDMAKIGIDPRIILEFFSDKGYHLDNSHKINAFMQVLMGAYNNTRMFENNGHTPMELEEMHNPTNYSPNLSTIPPTTPVTKIGRNDPCPCGSGKKFKICCIT